MSKKLLLADDSITIQKVIQITFAHENYDLTITDNGDDALAKAQEIKPDLILADVYMPGKDGYELTAAIKEDPELKNTPVLLLAGSFEPFDEEKAKNCQANAWIEKPFESQSLIDKVAELLKSSPVSSSEAQVSQVGDFTIQEEPSPQPEPLSDFGQPEPFEDTLVEEPSESFGDISFDDDAGVPESVGDSTSTSAEPPENEGFSTTEVDFDAEMFELGDDDILALEDEDILGAEDLEMSPQEQTLASWSRDEAETEDPFSETFAEEFESSTMGDAVFASESKIEEPVAEEPSVLDETTIAAESAFEEPIAEEPGVLDETAFAAESAFEEPVAEEPDVLDETAFAAESAFEEPVAEEPDVLDETAFAAESAFEEPVVEEPGVLDETAFAAESAFEEPVVEEPGVLDESAFAAESSTEEPVDDLTAVVENTQSALSGFTPPEEPEASDVSVDLSDIQSKASSLSDEELEKIVKKVVSEVVEKLAGSILEKVAWEVVPDLAESLIKEEIRKIKEAAA